VAHAALERIHERDGTFNAFCLVDPETTLGHARASEARYLRNEPLGPVDGVPVAVKDVFLTNGWPTLRGSKAIAPDQPWTDDAPAIAALKANGYVPIGKTTTPEFGWKGVTDSPLCGITRNPWNPATTAGGSSGGSAVAVASGIAPLALGTDSGGSIRIPAGFCGIVGLKPTFGVVPHWPTPPYGVLAHAGPMTWTVEDCALLLDVLSRPDPRDANAARPTVVDDRGELRRGVAGLRIAYSADLGYVDVSPEVATQVEDAARVFATLGAHVENVDPGFENPRHWFDILFFVGAFNAVRQLDPAARAQLEPALDDVARTYGGTSLEAYLEATHHRQMLAIAAARFHERYDLLLTPTLPLPAFEAGCEVPPGSRDERWPSWTPFTYPFNMTGQPALSVPCGFTSAGLPIGLQIVGPRYSDVLVLRAGHAFQNARPLTDRRPPV
jgi:aspartyl-tRNA(Asn)/glutamyl-tRNA(Gln) amidotransferase subunit A